MSRDTLRNRSGMGNFTVIENFILETDSLTLHEKMVYISLRRFMNNVTDTAFPGVRRIASMSRMSERKVRECIKTLRDKHWIDVETRENNTNIYTFLPMPGTLAPEHGAYPPAPHAAPPLHTVHTPPAHGADKQDLYNKTNNNNGKAVDEIPDRFESIWKHYPNKKGKANALKTYRKLVKEGVKDEDIIRGIKAYTRYCLSNRMEKRFMKHGSTFFNERAWEDDWTTEGQGQQSMPVASGSPIYRRYTADYSEGENW